MIKCIGIILCIYEFSPTHELKVWEGKSEIVLSVQVKFCGRVSTHCK